MSELLNKAGSIAGKVAIRNLLKSRGYQYDEDTKSWH